MKKQYSSFSEIDEQLRILKLKREIDSENIKLHLSGAKASVSPTRLVGEANIRLQKNLLTFAIQKLSFVSTRLRSFQMNRLISRLLE
ncbi:DUF6327 family protein [Arenibacter certesii]|uniref:Uncharacterized protein n=1 Tax=Arenibacter certesii TaxID=228955 RepID=A0A918MQE9_9FLAO|nr:DUF6327 family protein [Arenibacter certesii]GGW50769.1 hypothetical protein GCM10007383_38100 [Arenibacter certesii]